ncbi:MAG: hypothetical protein SGILL_007081 [Bacillariaceae sp.]
MGASQTTPDAAGNTVDTDTDTSSSEEAYASQTCSVESQNSGTCIQAETDSSDAGTDSTTILNFEENACQDDHDQCIQWSEAGECDKNPKFMLNNCRRSCDACDNDIQEPAEQCEDQHEQCEKWATASTNECEANPRYMHKHCKRSCGICPDQQLSQDELEHGVGHGERQAFNEHASSNNETEAALAKQDIQLQIAYMQTVKDEQIVSDDLYKLCTNRNEKCTIWAIKGECTANPGYMKKNCAPACRTCDFLDMEARCPPLDTERVKAAWEPGDLDAMFLRLVEEPYLSAYSVEILSRDPWVITMEDVIKEDEAERLIELGAEEGYERSGGVGKRLADGSMEKNHFGGRTSTNAWCHKSCQEDPLAEQVIHRLTNITHIHWNNSESLQLLRYEPGQFYKRHHDYIAEGKKRQPGVRILTMYLYLNDVEAGGGTKFNNLNITVMPKRGRALLWPSVYNDRPHTKDKRTDHEALPLEAGAKYGANAWFHQYDYQTPHAAGCS